MVKVVGHRGLGPVDRAGQLLEIARKVAHGRERSPAGNAGGRENHEMGGWRERAGGGVDADEGFEGAGGGRVERAVAAGPGEGLVGEFVDDVRSAGEKRGDGAPVQYLKW